MDNLHNSLQTRSVSRCYWHTLCGLFPLLVFYLACQLVDGTVEFYTRVNGLAPVYLMLALLLPAYHLMRINPETIWSPAFWLPVSSAVFYGFGPLVSVYGNYTTKTMMAFTNVAAAPADVFRANMLSTVGIFGLLIGFWLHTRLRAPLWRHFPVQDAPARGVRLIPLAAVFIGVGAFFRYAVMKPVAWGSSSMTIPGVITTLSPLVDLGFALLALSLAHRRSAKILYFFWLTWPLHLYLCALSLSKAEIILAIMLPTLAAYLGHRNRRRFGLSFLIMLLVFVIAQPWIHYGRAKIYAKTGTITQAGYLERTELLVQYLAGDESVSARGDDYQGWWTRLNYSEVQAYAMQAYDRGAAGSSLKDAWMLFIPRFVWQNKPIIVGPGKAFHGLVNNRREGGSFLALSVYGDLYWQFGWLGVVAISPLIGWLFAMLAWRSIAIMRQRNFLMLPLVVIALQAALLGMNKYLFNGIIAVVPIYYAYLLVIRLMLQFLGRRRKRAFQNTTGQRLGSSL
ncbi:MAG: hypothetical protein ABJ013_04360 [Halioglobus sp.]